MKKLAFLSLAALTFGAFAAEPKIPAESQAVLFLDIARTLALPALKDMPVPAEVEPGLPKPKDLKWAVATVDRIVLPDDKAASVTLPSLAVALSGDFVAKSVLEAVVKDAEKNGTKLSPIANLPFAAYSIPADVVISDQEQLKRMTNLKPCVGAVAKDVIVLAFNPDTLKAQGSLFGGKVTGGDFKKAMPACCLGLKVSGVDGLLAEAEAQAKKSGKGADASLEMFKGIKVVRFTADGTEGANLRLKLALACKDDSAAQGLEMGLGMFSLMAKDAVKDLKVSRKGKIVSVTGEVNPQELIGMAMMSMMGGQGMMQMEGAQPGSIKAE